MSGINGGENGDLVINIQVKQKKGFVRTGQDVVYYDDYLISTSCFGSSD